MTARKGAVLATKAVETQGKGSALRTAMKGISQKIQWKHKAKAVS